MFAIAFDLKVADTIAAHPSGQAPPAYTEIRNVLDTFGFRWIQGSVYVCESEDLANLYRAITALKQMAWFPPALRDLRAFRIEQWSDFTAVVKGP